MKVWKGGMSFHGGLLGGIIGISLYARVMRLSLLRLLDLGALLAPPGLGLGRIGNFIAANCPGAWLRRTCRGQWCFSILIPCRAIPLSCIRRFLEGVVLMVIVYIVARHRRKAVGWPCGFYILWYFAIWCGVFPRTGCSFGFCFFEFFHGAVVVRADVAYRRCFDFQESVIFHDDADVIRRARSRDSR